MLSTISTFAQLLSLVSLAVAANDWSKPCLSGVCSYDLPASAGASSGTLKIWGSPDAISDITPAAGWTILNCASDTLAQDIRLVCSGNATACAHLYDGAGAEGKVVRLPENCGKSAFARVAGSWVPTDQSVPPAVARGMVRRDGRTPQVKALALDTNFTATDSSKTGPVNFALRAANVPGANALGDLVTANSTTPQRRGRYMPRGLFDFVGDAIDAIKGLDSFDVNKTSTLPPLDLDKSLNLLNKNISCPPLTAGVKIDVDAKAHMVASVGVAATGTLLPPHIDDFGIITGLTADFDGTVDLNANVGGSLDSGKILLFQMGIPGLDFPGILTIGPSFEVNAQATATLDVEADLVLGINYHIANAQLVFPPPKSSSGKTQGAFNIGDTPLKLSVTPSVKATGTVAAHLIPSLNLGISALDDSVRATVFLELDASASMSLSLEAQAGTGVVLDGAKSSAVAASSGVATVGSATAASTKAVSTNAIASASAAPGGVKARGQTLPGHYFWHPPSAQHQTNTKTVPGMVLVNARAEATSSINAPSFVKALSSIKPASASVKPASASIELATSSVSATTSSVKATSSVKVTTSVKATNSGEATNSTAKVSSTSTASTTSSSIASASLTSVASSSSTSTGIVATTSASASFGGCFEIDAELDVNAGADASFFGLFDPNTKVALFSQKFELLKKCFGTPPTRRSLSLNTLSRLGRAVAAANKRTVKPRALGLTCLPPSVGAPEAAADDTVAAAAAKAV